MIMKNPKVFTSGFLLISQGRFPTGKKLVNGGDGAGLGALRALLYGEFNPLSFFKVAVAIALDSGEMDEYVLSTFTLDEAVAFAAVEPLDCSDNSFRHFPYSLL
jgi:hypothetical protein